MVSFSYLVVASFAAFPLTTQQAPRHYAESEARGKARTPLAFGDSFAAMGVPRIEVDLSLPPSERWEGLRPFVPAIVELAEMYERDLALARPYREMIALYRDQQSAELREELAAVAAMAAVDPLDLFLVNAYYDVFKHAMACTAFALDGPDGPIHARNLDWHSEGRALAKHTVQIDYRRGDELLFSSASWPGFLGTLSGVAPGRFAVTLNAVLSDDPAGVATPIAFQLRTLLERAGFDEAVAELERAPLSGDCLLLISGTENGQLRVIERTPTRSAVRMPIDGRIAVTNDYRAMASGDGEVDRELVRTSCGRFDQALARAHAERPTTPEACLDILSDPGVRMSITVQQMVMSARHGLLALRPVASE